MGNTKDHIFSADRPIATAEHDLLGRAPFAHALASVLSGWRGMDSLVVALYGTWGIGKSSIKNMILERLRSYDEERPHIVEYNPWHWSGQEQLSEGFFSDVGQALGRGKDSQKSRKIEHAWRLYAARLGVSVIVADGTRRAAVWALSIGVTLSLISPLAASHIPKTAAFISLIAGLLLLAGLSRFAEQLFNQLSTVAASRASLHEQKTLAEQKAELRELLAQINRPVLVVIDDIDRLRSDQIHLLFQLIKANADFPNLTYLLLFQRDIVESAVHDGASGREFLEKIIQVGFDVPSIDHARLYGALFEGLDRTLQEEVVAKRFDRAHWQAIFPAIKPFFRNLRDVARFLGSFSFHVAIFRKEGSFEVNPVDLVAVEVLRLFEPEVFTMMKDLKPLLTDSASLSGSKADPKADGNLIEKLISMGSEERREATRATLRELFPRVQTLLGGPSYSDGFAEDWFRALRICHRHVFDRYFLLALSGNDVSQADLDYLLENAGNRERVASRLREYAQSGRIALILERLDSYKERLPRTDIEAFVTALMDVGDLLPGHDPRVFFFGSETYAKRFIHWALKAIADPTERSTLLRRVCSATRGIALPLRSVRQQEAKDSVEAHPDWYFMSDTDIAECKTILLDRIREHASVDLNGNPFLSSILFCWKAWTDPSEVRRWVEGQLQSKSGILHIIAQLSSQYTSSGDRGAQIRYKVSLRTLREFVAIEAVETSLGRISHEDLNESDRLIVDAFRKARQREADGKVDDDDWHYEGD